LHSCDVCTLVSIKAKFKHTTMGSLLFNAALLGGGFALGRAPLLPLATQIVAELSVLPTTRKVPCCML